MRSPTVAPPVGHQAPRVLWTPEYATTAGDDAIEVAELAGLYLDPWQALVLRHGLGERTDGKWASFEVGLSVPRQNGKGGLLEARSLAGLFVLGERMITHSAHQFDTALEAFRRLLILIEEAPDLEQMVKRVSRSHGEEGIELKSGQRIRFRTRTKGGGRGFSGDCLLLDEAMILPETTVGALLPTLAARPNPQVWYTGSAVDQLVHEHGSVFARVRARGHAGGDDRLTWAEWSLDRGHPDEVTPMEAADPASVAIANPGYGIRITDDYTRSEQRTLDARTYAVERLGVGDWPDLDAEDGDGITRVTWGACHDPASVIADPVRIAFDVRPDRSRAAIAAAGPNGDGEPHVELIESRAGTAWLPARLKELQARHETGPILLQARSSAHAMVAQLDQIGVRYEVIDGLVFGQACGTFLDAVNDGVLRHPGQPQMQAAALGARLRPSGETLVWTRRGSAVDISPLVAATIAHHASTSGARRSVYEDRDLEIW